MDPDLAQLDAELWLEEVHRDWLLEHDDQRVDDWAKFFDEELEQYQKFCIDEDEAIWNAPGIDRLPYRQYLWTQVWKIRSAYAKRWGLCMRCGRRNVTLDCHHKTYARLGKERPSDLIALCRECHSSIHHR